jgi:hypothetical protein
MDNCKRELVHTINKDERHVRGRVRNGNRNIKFDGVKSRLAKKAGH